MKSLSLSLTTLILKFNLKDMSINKLFSQNIQYINEQYSSDLYNLLIENEELIALKENSDDTSSLYIDNCLICSDVVSDYSTYSILNRKSYSLIQIARVESHQESSLKSKISFNQLLFSDEAEIVSNLPALTKNPNKITKVRDIFLNGSLALPSLWQDICKNIDYYLDITSITVAETDLKYLAASFYLFSLEDFINFTKKRKIKFRLILNVSDNYLDFQEQVFNTYVSSSIISFNGICVINAFCQSNLSIQLRSWLYSHSGVGYRLIASLGFTTDELNQLYNYCHNKYYALTASFDQSKDKNPNIKDKAVTIVGSGPSLAQSIEELKLYRKDLYLVAAGSSISTLLENQIVPDVLVILERSKLIYDSLLELQSKFSHLSEIPLICAANADPNIASIFKYVSFYDRPFSITATLNECYTRLRLI